MCDDIILATTIFRWFNRISSGEALFEQIDFLDNKSAYEAFRETGDGQILKDALFKYVGPFGPFITGAYIIKSPNGMTKLTGVCWSLEHFWRDKYPLEYTRNGEHKVATVGWRDGAELMFDENNVVTLEQAWDWLRKFSYLGDFMAYEVVTDLRFTHVLDRAPDIMTWANAGPGAMRGLNRLHGRKLMFRQKKQEWNAEMQKLLELSKDEKNWPWPERPLEMREIEHSLCEYDKWVRAEKGEGRPRGTYR
jgi:hypothetical protein